MATEQPSYHTNLPSVISPRYCSHQSDVHLKIAKKRFAVTDSRFIVTNMDTGEQVFKVDRSLLTCHHRRVLRDADGNPVVTLRKKIRTMHDRWEVFKGDSTEDLVFSVRRSSMIQWGYMNLEVFLAENNGEACDFKVDVEKLLKRSCSFSAGPAQSPRIIAKMEKKSGYNVTVPPNTDYAFAVALIVILDDLGHFDFLTKLTFKSLKALIDPFDTTGFVFSIGLNFFG